MAVEGENISAASIAEYNATLAEKEAEADRRAKLLGVLLKPKFKKHNMFLNKNDYVLKKLFVKRLLKLRLRCCRSGSRRARRVAKGEADAFYSNMKQKQRVFNKFLMQKQQVMETN